MKTFKIRCSAIGQIMGQPRLKKEREAGELSQTAKTYCQTWLKEQLYSRRKEFTSKYTDKGQIMEDNSIDFISEQLNLGFIIKNDKRESNAYMSGECDVILPDFIIDSKNSWDAFTFPLFETETDKKYWWQGQGYMELYKRDLYKLIYVLSDTPYHLIEREAYYYAKNNGYEDLTDNMLQEFVKKMTYKDIPDNLKIKIFEFEKDIEAIKQIEQQVLKCRNYIKTLLA